jgi:hypothetical protein
MIQYNEVGEECPVVFITFRDRYNEAGNLIREILYLKGINPLFEYARYE